MNLSQYVSQTTLSVKVATSIFMMKTIPGKYVSKFRELRTYLIHLK